MKKFCETCGKKLEKIPQEGFDSETGEPKSRMVCPTKLCFHEGYPRHETDEERSGIEYGGWFKKDFYNYHCKRCGYSSREVFVPWSGI